MLCAGCAALSPEKLAPHRGVIDELGMQVMCQRSVETCNPMKLSPSR